MISEAQRTARQQYIGSSDAAAICGLDPYRSPADIFLEKTGQAEGFEGNEHTERGNFLEPALINWLRVTRGILCSNDVMRVAPDGLLAANFDGINEIDKFTVEAKTATNVDEWGAEESDEIPERHIVQVHHGLYVAGPEFRIGYVPVLLPGYRSLDFRLYVIERDDALAEAIAAKGREFMTAYVRPGIRPTDFRPSLDVLKRIRRTPNKVVNVPDALVDALIVARAAKSQAEKDAKAAEAAVLEALGDAEGGTFGSGQVTYMQTKRRGYVVEETTYRTLRVKSAKEK